MTNYLRDIVFKVPLHCDLRLHFIPVVDYVGAHVKLSLLQPVGCKILFKRICTVTLIFGYQDQGHILIHRLIMLVCTSKSAPCDLQDSIHDLSAFAPYPSPLTLKVKVTFC